MILKPQDILVMRKLVIRDSADWSYPALSHELSMSVSEVHAGVRRAVAARLMDMHRKTPVKSNLIEFVVHGVKYAYPPDRGGLTRGIPTSYAAPPLTVLIVQPDDPPPVWPDPEGPVCGYEFSPLFSAVPAACKVDPKLCKSNKRCGYHSRSCFGGGLPSVGENADGNKLLPKGSGRGSDLPLGHRRRDC